MKNKPKNIPSPYKSKGTPIYRDTTALPFDNGGKVKTHISKDGTVTNKIINAKGEIVIQVKTPDGQFYEKIENPKTIKHIVDKRPEYAKGYYDPYNVPDNTLENIVEIVDPTGMTSWDDIIRAKREFGPNSLQYNIEMLGAIPLVGKATKTLGALKTIPMTARQKRSFNTSLNTLKGMGIIGRGTDTYQAIEETNILPFADGGNMQNPPIISSFLPPTYPFNYNYNFLNPNYKVISENPNAGTESMWNPMNWLVPKMDQEVTFNAAFEKAKRAGYSEFIYNGQRYNTKSDLTPDQQMKVYGITDDRRTLDPSQARKNLSILNTEEGYSGGAQAAISRMLGISPGLNFGINEGKAPGAKEQDAFRLYLGLPQSYNTFQPSKYKKGALELTGYNALLPDIMPSDKELEKYGVPKYSETWGNQKNPLKPYDDFVMGRHTVKKGKDSRGEYIEYIDKWDLDTYKYNIDNRLFNAEVPVGSMADMLNKPFDIYGRKYYKDYGDGVKRTMYYSDQELQSFNPKNKNFDTLALQKELANRGYKFPKSTTKSGEFDGVYGEETKKALQDWQSKNFQPGETYTFSGRPGSYYKYTEEGNMLIKNKNTGGKYIPMTDEDGKRLKTLQAGLATGKTKKFLDGGPLVDKTNHGNLLPSVYASALGNYYAQGGMIKRADGSYSPRGLWDNIRAAAAKNKAVGKPGKEPSKEMLAQAKKIEAEEKQLGGYLYGRGGQFPTPYSLPEDSFKQGGDNLHNSVYASSMAQYPATYAEGGLLDTNPEPTPEFDNRTKTMMYLLSKGLDPNQAAGIAGNLEQESGFNPTARNKSGYTGIAQWDKKNRWPAVKKYIESQGLDPWSLEGQLEGLYWEANKRGDWNKIAQTTNPAESTAAWLKYFERSGEKPGQAGYEKRINYANNLAADENVLNKVLAFSPPNINELPLEEFPLITNEIPQTFDINHREEVEPMPVETPVFFPTNSPTSLMNLANIQRLNTLKYGGSFQMPRQQMYMPLDNVERLGGPQHNAYRKGGSVFYATNTPQLEGEGKDLTYPQNAYIYTSGGLINNFNIKRYEL